ncbi:enterochelin esterase [Rosenbergiella collisarenosi]|uniref:enterochelin esterase n=1 Tax=Rosenbergiella collisarenosi TaxID=1544695 RepID=UPI001BDAEC24|nr:enterochelin esterase [Rosenbergiella collisarenosi]MBT0719779.1 enterochelin esterase [Rosenbergiella collisarenosi]
MLTPEWFTPDIGSDIWWRTQQQLGVPRIERLSDQDCRVTFLWRQPDSQLTQAVWLNITGITDHHQPEPPVSLVHYPASDVWYLSLTLPAHWRGSYCLIPDTKQDIGLRSQDIFQRREWWREQFRHAEHDKLNSLRSWSAGRGMAVSPLHLPDAPPQVEWQAWERGEQSPVAVQEIRWESRRLGNSRRVWWYSTADHKTTPHRRLALLLDGQFWANTLPIAGPLQQLTDEGRLPPALYVMPEIIDREHRGREYPCNRDFWLAVNEELLPLIAKTVSWRPDPAQTIVTGQSFGGLASVYACLNWPDIYGKALSLSGSFWWPNRGHAAGYLPQQLAQHAPSKAPRKIILEAGCRETLICEANRELEKWLTYYHIPHRLQYVEGGHDALWWRGSLLEGLHALWQEE